MKQRLGKLSILSQVVKRPTVSIFDLGYYTSIITIIRLHHSPMIESVKQFLNITSEDLKKPFFSKQKDSVFYLLLNTKANTFTKTSLRLISVIRKRHPFPSALRDMIIFSKQFQAKEALQNKFIDGILSEEEAIGVIHKQASEVSFLGENKQSMKKIKCELHRDVVVSCFEKQTEPNTIAYIKMRDFPKL